MKSISSVLLAALFLAQPVAALVASSAGRGVLLCRGASAHQARALPFEMLTEEEEYQEFVKKKLGNVKKLGSDENFGDYRRVESSIYTIGGAPSHANVVTGCQTHRPGTVTLRLPTTTFILVQVRSRFWCLSSPACGRTTRAT